MTRKYDVDVIKLVFAIFVAMGHLGFHYVSSSIIVDCFFALSGYFLIKSYDSGKYTSAFAYSKNRVARFYPYYIAAFIMLLVYTFLWSLKNSALNDFFAGRLMKTLPEMFFMQNAGIFPEGGMK